MVALRLVVGCASLGLMLLLTGRFAQTERPTAKHSETYDLQTRLLFVSSIYCSMMFALFSAPRRQQSMERL